MNIKIGKKYKVKNNKCRNYRDFDGAYIVITDTAPYLKYDIFDSSEEKKGSCFDCFTEEDLIPFEKTLEDLDIGDILELGRTKKMVLGVVGKLIFLSAENEFDSVTKGDSWNVWTLSDIKSSGWNLVIEKKEEETIEIEGKKYSVSDIKKALNK